MTPNLSKYDYIIIAFSGGKDSFACLLTLLDMGVPREKIELWHHLVDGKEGSHLMDWPCTVPYIQAAAKAFEVPLYLSWKVGGFEREMLRHNQRTAPTRFETPEGEVRQIGGIRGKLGTRLKFPQVSANLRVRWCSAYLKIQVAAAALRNQERFENAKTLVITGERAEESRARARYVEFQAHGADNRNGKSKRHIDHWRNVLKLRAIEIWRLMEKYRVNPHPAYRLGWGRVSCQSCIFGSHHQWASIACINPDGLAVIADYEHEFGLTIHRKLSVMERVRRGTPYEMKPADIQAALATTFDEPIILPADSEWRLPAGAFGEMCGPT